jgi:drug/metabolite transporter (DMT)-like permease
MKQDRFAVGIVFVLITVLSWGGTFPIGKHTVAAIDPFWLTTWRFGFVAAVFAALLAVSQGVRGFRYEGRFAAAALVGAVGFAGFNVFAFLALRLTTAEHVAIVNALQTPMTALAHWAWRGVKPRPFTLVCIGVAFAGVVLVVTHGDPRAALERGSLAGAGFAIAAAASWVTYVLGGVKLASFGTLRFTTLTILPGAAVVLLVTLAATAAGLAQPPAAATLVAHGWEMAYLILITSVVGVFSWNAGVQRIGPLNTVLLANLIPVVVFAIGLAQGRRFDVAELAGAGLVIGALVANNLLLRRTAARA